MKLLMTQFAQLSSIQPLGPKNVKWIERKSGSASPNPTGFSIKCWTNVTSRIDVSSFYDEEGLKLRDLDSWNSRSAMLKSNQALRLI